MGDLSGALPGGVDRVATGRAPTLDRDEPVDARVAERAFIEGG